jgi:hypothetical protein
MTYEQPRWPFGGVLEDVWRVGWNVDRFAGCRDSADSTERNLEFAVKNREHFLEVVAVRRPPAAWRNMHVDLGVMPSGMGA